MRRQLPADTLSSDPKREGCIRFADWLKFLEEAVVVFRFSCLIAMGIAFRCVVVAQTATAPVPPRPIVNLTIFPLRPFPPILWS
jgi:hypothetical protein